MLCTAWGAEFKAKSPMLCVSCQVWKIIFICDRQTDGKSQKQEEKNEGKEKQIHVLTLLEK